MKTFSLVDSNLQKIIFKKVIELSFDDLSYKKIIKQIAMEFNVKLSLGTLSYWFNHNVNLFGGVNKFEAKASSELVYCIGVMFGDGNIFHDKKKQDYVVRLDAIDKDFVEYFSNCVSKVLNKENNYVVIPCKRESMVSIMYCSKARSKILYYFIKELKNDFKKVKFFAQKYPKEFIMGLADSEGCPTISSRNIFQIGVCVAYSMNVELLAFVCLLLKFKFGIKSKIRLARKKGVVDSVINGRPIKRKNDLYSLVINDFKSTKLFSQKIGFVIGRKNQKLLDSIEIFEGFPKNKRVSEWCKKYFKPKSKWVPNVETKFDN